MAEELSRKDRMKIPRQKMRERDPVERAASFEEVNLGFTAELARQEAIRCIQCPKPKCVQGCPVGIEINEFVRHVAEGEFLEAAKVLKKDNSLPAVCGRVCPQEEQCEAKCVVGKKHEPIAIGHLERFVADYEREIAKVDHGKLEAVRPPERTGKRVAIVGSGPSGLSCATDLAKMGHDVTVFEALHKLGGVLVYGIPEFRLPNEIVEVEVDQLRKLGVTFVTDAVIGMGDTIDDLLGEEEYDAVFIGVGAGLPRFLNVPGENLIGIYSANEFLTRVNLMGAFMEDGETPVFGVKDKNVVVFGGGNTAMDAVRTSLRLGARSAKIIYRRSRTEMPARNEEIHHAEEEGVEFVMLTNPTRFDGDEDGWLESVTLQEMELGEPDDSGRRRPVPIEGSEYVEPIDMAVIAIGNKSNPLIEKTTPDIDHTRWGTIVVDERSMRTSKQGVFAGGDIVTGGATVILAMGAGRTAAKSIHDWLETGVWELPPEPEDSEAEAATEEEAAA